MVFPLVLCFLFLICKSYSILPGKISRPAWSKSIKDLEFVEAIKQDLRRNNDDYIEIMRRSGSRTSIPPGSPFNTTAQLNSTLNTVTHGKEVATNITNITQLLNFYTSTEGTRKKLNNNKGTDNKDFRYKIVDKIRKRVNRAFVSREINRKSKDNNVPQRRSAVGAGQQISNGTKLNPINDQDKKSFRKGLIKMKQNNRDIQNKYRFITKNKINLFTLYALSNNVPVQTTTPKLKTITPHDHKHLKQKRKRIEKFQRFVEKNKELLKDFVSNKMATQSQPVTAPQKLFFRQNQSKIMSTMSDLQLKMQQALGGLRGKKSMEELPDAALLDMAPARGGRVHHKRLRGRLCHRHVLIPEGPKYDSGGRIYLPPHGRMRHHEYNVTHPPPLLLPRCCNCCKKSVLGCE